MAQWEHKEARWDAHGENSGLFVEWLDKQCIDGWEVIKISRSFTSPYCDTWVVFRRLLHD